MLKNSLKQGFPVLITMIKNSLKQGFSFRNILSTSSFFEILNHGTNKVHKDQLKDESYVSSSKR